MRGLSLNSKASESLIRGAQRPRQGSRGVSHVIITQVERKLAQLLLLEAPFKVS